MERLATQPSCLLAASPLPVCLRHDICECRCLCPTLRRQSASRILPCPVLPSLCVPGFPAAQVPVLFALRETQLFELARCMRNHTVVAGQVVFRQGDAGASPTLPYPRNVMHQAGPHGPQ